MSKAKQIFILVFLMLITSFQPVLAAWWQKRDIELPPATRETKKQEKELYGEKMLCVYYESTLRIIDLKDFYRRRLPALGWKEKPLKEQIEKNIPKEVDPDKRYQTFLDYNLMFEKGDKELIISFLPENLSDGGKTKFSTAELPKRKEEVYRQGKVKAPALLTKPTKNIAPEFPEAKLMFLSGTDTSMKATYFTSARADEALRFYKENMAKYNWLLVKETPFTQVKTIELFRNKFAPPQPLGLENICFAELTFDNNQGDTCTIGIVESELLIKGVPKKEVVNIRVDYEQKR